MAAIALPNSVKLTNIDLNCDVVVVESHSQHLVRHVSVAHAVIFIWL